MKQITFEHAPTLRAALLSEASVRVVQGPVESGKTTWGIGAIVYEACTMPRCLDGIRRSRWLVTRQTDAELQRGPVRSFREWFSEDEWGPIVGKAPAVIVLKFLDVELEVEFFAFEDDSPASMKRLRSTDYTGIYINEGQYRTLKFVKLCQQRTGRFPAAVTCPDYDRKKRVIMDMNAPPMNDHWVHYMRGDFPMPADFSKDERRKHKKPDSWEFFVQPPTVLPIYDEEGDIVDFVINEGQGDYSPAENLPFQQPEEIMEMVSNGDIDDIKRDYMNLTVQIKSGKPRYPKFQRKRHVAPSKLEPVADIAPIIGYDPGINGAAVFFQRINNRWRATHEIYCRDNPDLNAAAKVGRRMKQILGDHFPWYTETGVVCWGDQFGSRQQTGPNDTYYDIISQFGLFFQSPDSKDKPSLRWQIGKAIVEQFPEGSPRLEICPIGCPMFVDGMDGGATMKVEKTDAGQGILESINKKSKFADIVEAAEYAWWGGGESTSIVELPREEKPAVSAPKARMDIFSRSAMGRSNRTVRLPRRR